MTEDERHQERMVAVLADRAAADQRSAALVMAVGELTTAVNKLRKLAEDTPVRLNDRWVWDRKTQTALTTAKYEKKYPPINNGNGGNGGGGK